MLAPASCSRGRADDLNRQLAPYGCATGREPATHANRTIGGMIGNNLVAAPPHRRTARSSTTSPASGGVALRRHLRWCGETSDEECRRDRTPGGPAGDRPAGGCAPCATPTRTSAAGSRRPAPGLRVGEPDSPLPEYGFDVAGLLVGASRRWSPFCGGC
ncbi:FAD-dependent oxidoreductase [Streptomyces thinghirensis]|nr:FAD-dependent oxidoreductase [Streptomyces thinghirensis]